MKRTYWLFFMFCAFGAKSQTSLRDNAGLKGREGAISGFFETWNPVNYPSGANSYWHLLDVRHSNLDNNYAMQFSGSFFDQNLYFRKTNDNPARNWSRILTEADGKVGIGMTTPAASLDIFRKISTDSQIALKIFYQGSWGVPQYATDFRFIDIASTEEGKVLQVGPYGMGLGYEPPVFHSPDRLYINGNVGIGTTSPKEKLSVNGKIRAHEIKVDASDWPDYVFDESYKKESLTDIENFILRHKHLPGMPSARVVAESGVGLGEMNELLLKKIEELTLHLIEKEKAINSQGIVLKSELDKRAAQEERIKKLEELILEINSKK
ncbi:hypothetical protein QWY86_15655 [Pedobacter aquatilis]|uniref:hypothetical protein n=1 Tax=Pedobacter aquatilis TaxID=351343 RepID=UPI0025B29B4B|nr:hypothetical protein [Pedobacter aquatilis]MDN3588119.1 hypothetical protein [Pedobacter aquatilis]